MRPATVACSIFRSRMFASFLFTDLIIAGGVGSRSFGSGTVVGEVCREEGVLCCLARFLLLYSRCLGDAIYIGFGEDGVDEGGVDRGDGEGDFGGVFVCLGGD